MEAPNICQFFILVLLKHTSLIKRYKPAQALNIDDFELNKIALYPNPANTSFQINTDVSNIDIYDITGKEVKSFSGDFDNSNQYDVSDLKSGVYLVNIITRDNKKQTSKLIKM